ncbi:RNA helicase, partial [Streptomyces turgidiscabies]
DRPSGGFNRDNDRGGRSFERRDERPSGSGGGFRRDDRRDGGGDRGGFRRDDRPSTGHRGSDRPFNRDRQGDRPAGGGFRAGGHDRPSYGRRDDHRGSGTGTGSGSGSSFGRRDEKPRWKRNG